MNNEEFLIKIDEYNVNREKTDKITYLITNQQIQINGEDFNGNTTDIITKIKNLILSKETELESISKIKPDVMKGGRQQRITIKLNEKEFNLVGNVSQEEMKNLYTELKEEIEKIIKKD